MPKTYVIKRFYYNGDKQTIVRGLTLEQAQTHCQREDTKGGSVEAGDAWFDGYDEET